jgi:dihydroxyacetone kinase-like protein
VSANQVEQQRAITIACITRFLERAAERIAERREELTQLDSPIGDADHGANLDRGFSAVAARLPELVDQDAGLLLRNVGTTLVSTVGGSSGPLYGTAFIRAGTVLANKPAVLPHELVAALEAGLEGICARGKAKPGEKTMIDTLDPFVAQLRTALVGGADLLTAMRTATAAAEAGMHATIAMRATKGRASYLGERSIGHQDPGATSAFYLVQVMLEVLEESVRP